MKKLILILGMLALPAKSYAGVTDSFWFEPAVFCAAGAGGGYVASPSGDEVTYAAIGCATGALIGYFVNSYYDNKFGSKYQGEIQDLTKSLQEFQAQMAQSAMKGEDTGIGLRVREIIPGKKHSDGSVSAPTVRETLVLPGEGLRIGE